MANDARAQWQRQQQQQWSAWFKAFGADLVPITPPGGAIAEGSDLTAKGMGKAPGVMLSSGAWQGISGWNKLTTTAADVEAYSAMGAGIGVSMRNAIAFDVDLVEDRDTDLGERCRSLIEGVLGKTMVRGREGSGRCLLLYHQPPEAIIGKRVLVLRDAATKQPRGKIELLTIGQQAVVAGPHQSGVLYRWNMPPLPVDQLPPMPQDGLMQVLDSLMPAMQQAGVEVIDKQGRTGKLADVDAASLKASDLKSLAAAVQAIPNERITDYNDFIVLLIAIKGACGGDEDFYRNTVEPWALRFPSNTPEFVRAKWDSVVYPHLGADYVDAQARKFGHRSAPLVSDFVPQPGPAPAALPHDDWLDKETVPRKGKKAKKEDADDHTNDRDVAIECAGMALIQQYLFVPWASAREKWAKHVEGVVRFSHGYHADLLRSVSDTATALHGSKLGTAAKARNVEAFLQSHLKSDGIGSFDADLMSLNTPDGVVDLLTGRLRPHQYSDRFTLQTTARVGDPDLCALMDRCVLDWACGNAALATTIWQAMASTLLGRPAERRMLNLYGHGSNGKSLLMNVMQGVLGGYAITVGKDTFVAATRNADPNRPRPELLALRGKRLIIAPEAGRQIDVSLLKLISGNDLLTVRTLYAEPVSFYCGTVCMVSNDIFRVDHVDAALAMRVRVIPFDASFADDPTLVDRLLAERDHILAKLIDVCVSTQGRIAFSDSVADATQDALDEADPWRALCRTLFDFTGDPRDLLPVAVIIDAVRQRIEQLGGGRMARDMIGVDNAGVMSRLSPVLRALGARRAGSRPPVQWTGMKLKHSDDWIT